MTTLIDDFFGQVSRALDGGASGPEAFTLLLRLLDTHFDRVDTGEGYTNLQTFGMCNGTPFSEFSREFRVLVSAVMGYVLVGELNIGTSNRVIKRGFG